MRFLLRCLPVFAVALVFVVAGLADDKKAADKKPVPFASTFTFPKAVTPTEDQQKQLAELQKEYTPKLEEFKKKTDAILTPERLKAQKEAIGTAKADGKKGKELNEAGQAALKLTPEEQKELTETKSAQGKLMGEINKKKMALLTDEQKKALQPKPKDVAKDKDAKDKDKDGKDKGKDKDKDK